MSSSSSSNRDSSHSISDGRGTGDVEESAFSLNISDEFGSFDDAEGRLDNLTNTDSLFSSEGDNDAKFPVDPSFMTRNAETQSIKSRNGSGNEAAEQLSTTPPRRSLSPVREDEEDDEDMGTISPATPPQQPPSILLKHVVSPSGRDKLVVNDKSPARAHANINNSPRRNSAMPSASSLSLLHQARPRRGRRSRHSVKTMNTSKMSESSDILVNPDVMTLLSEELHVAIVDSKVQRVGIRGKLEIRAKVKPGSDSAISNNPNIRGAFFCILTAASRC